jgi:hypothetical protein
MIVEYALRDSSKPMGVAQYRLSAALPPRLQQDLPTIEEFAREFPLMSVVKLRIEIERVHDYAAANCFAATRPAGIGAMLRDLQRRGLAPPSTENFLDALRVMNAASHGGRSDAEGAERAVRLGTAFLAELTEQHRA